MGMGAWCRGVGVWVQVYRSVDAGVCVGECMDVWVHGCMGVRVYVSWIYGCVDITSRPHP